MTHPFQKHREQHPGRARVKHILKAEGGEVENIDVGESFPGGLKDSMYDLRSAKDAEEVEQGKRFSDNGSRIPGRLKARNDAYSAKLKKR